MARSGNKTPDDRLTGTIKSLHADKGFGFIQADNGTEYFFHRSAVGDFDLLARGVTVRFVPVTGTKGPRAEDVEVIR